MAAPGRCMNRLHTSLLLVGAALSVTLVCLRTSGQPRSKNPEKNSNVTTSDEETSITFEASVSLSLPATALAKLDPVFIERLESYRNGTSGKIASQWNAMVVLNIPDDLQESLANVFEHHSENSSGHHYNDRSPTRAENDALLENAYTKRKRALARQAEILEDFSDSFLSAHPGLSEQEIRSRLQLAPMISITAPPEQILTLAKSDAVRHIGADAPAEKAIERVASEARFAHAWNSDFLDGSGVKVALLEEFDVPFANLVGPGRPIKSPAAIYDPDNVTDHEHSSNTAAVLWGQDSFFRGLALGSTPYFATAETTTGRAAATDWCIQQGVSVISMSWGSPAGQNDGNLKWFDLYYDWVTEINRVLVVAAAGNDGNEAGRVIHPGAAFNVLTVGALDGNDPNSWNDDVVASYSSHVDPNTGTMKPEVVSYGTNIKAAGVAPAFSTLSSGTSYATPAVAAAAALCIQENPASADEPMLLKAQLMASAVSHDFAGTDRDGVGTVLAQAYNASTSARTINRTGTENLEWNITLDGGRKNRIVLCYPHRPNTSGTPNSGTSVDNHNSYHEIDLDLELWVGGTKVAQSDFGINNPFEVIDYTPASTIAATVRIVNFDWKSSDPRDSIRVGLAAGSNLNFGTGPDDSNDDSFEPNDSEGETKLLSLDANLPDMRSTDEDWFRLEVPPHTTTTVRIEHDDDIGDLDLAAHRTDNASATVTSISERDFEEVTLFPSTDPKTWRVRVFPYNPTADRASYSLRVLSDLPLRAPTPTDPSDLEVTSITPRLTCTASSAFPEDATPRAHQSSRWQIANDAAFTDIVLDESVASQTEYTVPNGRLSENRIYYWRVRHVDQDNRPGPWSQSRRIDTKTTGGGPTETTLQGIERQWIGDDLRITWDPVANADSYNLYRNGQLIGTGIDPEFLVNGFFAGERRDYLATTVVDGVESTGTQVSAVAPAALVDGLIGLRANRLRGNGRYNANARGQQVNSRIVGNRRTRIFFAGQNDSSVRSPLSFRMKYSRRNVRVKARTLTGARQNITAAVTRSGYTVANVPGQSTILFDARIFPKSRNGVRRTYLRIFNAALSANGLSLSGDVTAAKLRRR